jgi:hypothetical protein
MVVRPQGCDQAFDGTIHYLAVGIEQKYVFRSRLPDSKVTGGGKTKVYQTADYS